jgi:hypothetical protein
LLFVSQVLTGREFAIAGGAARRRAACGIRRAALGRND